MRLGRVIVHDKTIQRCHHQWPRPPRSMSRTCQSLAKRPSSELSPSIRIDGMEWGIGVLWIYGTFMTWHRSPNFFQGNRSRDPELGICGKFFELNIFVVGLDSMTASGQIYLNLLLQFWSEAGSFCWLINYKQMSKHMAGQNSVSPLFRVTWPGTWCQTCVRLQHSPS